MAGPTKADMAAEIQRLTGEEVNPDAFKADELRTQLDAAQAAAEQDDAPAGAAASQKPEEAPDTVQVRLGVGSPVSALVVRGVRVERARTATLRRDDFDQHREQYRLEEVEE